jgi:Flp pilus assembly protein TadD
MNRRRGQAARGRRGARAPLGPGDALAVVSLVALGFTAFAPVLGFPFLNWDDPAYVVENPAIRSLAPAALGRLFVPSAVVVANWAPVTLLSYAMDHAAAGLDPGAYHRTNLVLHLASGALVYLLLRGVVGARAAAWAGALLFLLHPVQVESVAWVAERKNVLSLALGLGAFLVARHARARPRRHAAALILFALALMAKATVVVLPLLLAAAWILLDREPAPAALRRAAPYLVLALAAGLATLAAQGSAGGIKPYYGGNALLTAATMLRVVWLELLLFVDPRRLAAIYRPPIATSLLEPAVVAAAAGLVASAVVVWGIRRRAPRAAFFAAWYAIGLLPVVNLVPLPHLMADRFLYLSSIGLAGLAALGLAAAASAAGRPRAVTAVVAAGALLGAACFAATRARLPVWSDSERLWRDALAHAPDAEVAHANLGEALTARGAHAEALEHYRRALALRPDYEEARLNLANALARLGRAAEAESMYATALARTPGDPETHYNLGAARLQAGDRAGARAAFDQALRLDPRHAGAHQNLAVIAYSAGDFPGALAHLDAAVAAAPGSAEIHSNRGLVLGRLGRQDEAMAELRSALALRPDYPLGHFNLGLVLLAGRDVDGARAEFARAVALDPALAERVPPPARP